LFWWWPYAITPLFKMKTIQSLKNEISLNPIHKHIKNLKFLNNPINNKTLVYEDFYKMVLGVDIRQEYNIYNDLKQKLLNKEYDLESLKSYEITFKTIPINKVEDLNIYEFINKKYSYLKIDLFNILKILYKHHKINKFDYKASIKRITNNKPLKNKVIQNINMFYSTLKTNTNKNTLTKSEGFGKPKITIKTLGTSYKVIIKKHKYKQIINNINPEIDFKTLRLSNIYRKINIEFNQRLVNCNKYL